MFLCVLRLSFAITWPSGTKSWNYLKRTTLKKNVGSQAHRLTVNFLKEHPFKYIWINKVKSEKGICPKNLELFLIHLVVVNFRPRRNAINLVISFFWGGRWGVGGGGGIKRTDINILWWTVKVCLHIASTYNEDV